MQNLIITGQSGSGKSSLSEGLIHVIAPEIIRLEYSRRELSSGRELPQPGDLRRAPSNSVLILDECSKEVMQIIGKAEMQEYLAAGGRVICECRRLDDLDEDLFTLMCRYGRFRHIDIGLNDLLAAPPSFPISMPVKMWESMVLNKNQAIRRDNAAKVVIGELVQAVAELDVPSEHKALLYAKIGILANAVSNAASPNGIVAPHSTRGRRTYEGRERAG